jgi:hypothetical protein
MKGINVLRSWELFCSVLASEIASAVSAKQRQPATPCPFDEPRTDKETDRTGMPLGIVEIDRFNSRARQTNEAIVALLE